MLVFNDSSKKVLKKDVQKGGKSEDACDACDACTLLGRFERNILRIESQASQASQASAPICHFWRTHFVHFLETVWQNEEKDPTKTASTMARMTNTLALSAPPGPTDTDAHGGEHLPPPPAKGVSGEGPLWISERPRWARCGFALSGPSGAGNVPQGAKWDQPATKRS